MKKLVLNTTGSVPPSQAPSVSCDAFHRWFPLNAGIAARNDGICLWPLFDQSCVWAYEIMISCLLMILAFCVCYPPMTCLMSLVTSLSWWQRLNTIDGRAPPCWHNGSSRHGWWRFAQPLSSIILDSTACRYRVTYELRRLAPLDSLMCGCSPSWIWSDTFPYPCTWDFDHLASFMTRPRLLMMLDHFCTSSWCCSPLLNDRWSCSSEVTGQETWLGRLVIRVVQPLFDTWNSRWVSCQPEGPLATVERWLGQGQCLLRASRVQWLVTTLSPPYS